MNNKKTGPKTASALYSTPVHTHTLSVSLWLVYTPWYTYFCYMYTNYTLAHIGLLDGIYNSPHHKTTSCGIYRLTEGPVHHSVDNISLH